jgi:hypothetical protein
MGRKGVWGARASGAQGGLGREGVWGGSPREPGADGVDPLTPEGFSAGLNSPCFPGPGHFFVHS